MLSAISTVLVVDDNPIARATAVDLFTDLGFKVLDGYNGATALKLIKEYPEVGLLFLDVRMPGMNGPEVADAAQKLGPWLKIVFMSGYDDRDVPPRAAFVRKPLDLKTLANAVAAAIGGEAPVKP
jgi:CheY-like chemotaxis protein